MIKVNTGKNEKGEERTIGIFLPFYSLGKGMFSAMKKIYLSCGNTALPARQSSLFMKMRKLMLIKMKYNEVCGGA